MSPRAHVGVVRAAERSHTCAFFECASETPFRIGFVGWCCQGYYLSAVARGAEDYYLGAGEAPGRWCGSASAELKLEGEVVGDELRAVLRGRDPASDHRLARRNQTLPGFDCTFSAPKSVSIVHALGDDFQRRVITEAHEAAVNAAVGYLERQAAFGRRGRDGVNRVETSGFVAAAFRHRTSRASDPHLHTHVVVANLVKAIDGRWGALDGRLVYAHKMDAGAVYQCHLRAEISDRLGLEWNTPRNGLAELSGVPAQVVKEFSRRRAEIEAALAARGESSAAAAATATLATRNAKQNVDAATLVDEWRERADALGFGAEQIAKLSRARGFEPACLWTDDALEELTANASYFDRRNAIRVLATSSRVGMRVDELEIQADRCLAHRSVVPLTPDDLTGPRFTTRQTLETEARLLGRVAQGRDLHVAVANQRAVDAAIAARPSLTGEQEQMVSAITRSGAAVDVVVGAAGAGKTFALDAARAAWTASGNRVVGCALAARAAAQLEHSSGIPSFTISAMRAFLEHDQLPADSVLVVDEAGMVGTRALEELTAHAHRSRAKVVLIGDHRQLPEIEAGGAFARLARDPHAITLEENRRQRDRHERRALADWRKGRISDAVERLTRRGNVVHGDNADLLRQQLVADWKQSIDNGDVSLMLARRRVDVADLNLRARQLLKQTGGLDASDETTIGGLPLCEGDWVVARRNDRRIGVHNGDLGVVTAIDEHAATVMLDRGPTVVVPADYIGRGHLDHGYAITIHKAQGATCDRTFVLGDDSLHNETGYTAMSRGRQRNRLYVMAPDPHAENPGAHDTLDRHHFDIVEALRRSEAQQLATDLLAKSQRRTLARGAGIEL
ncbi:MAG TPA: MobF family relaxase [Acidimicrobiales bacterium]|nr:MobF family relaxase [Acidimicrobiales bacterium]